jgi:hypothetical protein
MTCLQKYCYIKLTFVAEMFVIIVYHHYLNFLFIKDHDQLKKNVGPVRTLNYENLFIMEFESSIKAIILMRHNF